MACSAQPGRVGGHRCRRPRPARWLLAATLAAWAASPHDASAALGEPESSVATDQARLEATRRPTERRSRYTVHELSLASRSTAVREFVAPTGVVFGVAWKGRVRPELGPLLGRYAAEYEQAERETPREHGSRRRRVESAHVVVETWGHMRNLQGRAYVPSLLPDGVRPDDVR